jgi:hypothetical protein
MSFMSEQRKGTGDILTQSTCLIHGNWQLLACVLHCSVVEVCCAVSS